MFFPAIIIPILLGTSYAWHSDGVFDARAFAAALVAAVFYHGGMNVINDYFDHLNGADAMNRTPLTPFAGGSRMIQKGLMEPKETLYLAVVLLSAGSLIGLYLAYLKGPLLILIGAVGLLSGFFYSAPPLFFAGRGLGELMVGLNFGLLTVSGSYYVQTGTLKSGVFFISLPLSFLIAGLLYMNEFPDYEADRISGKRNLLVRLGPERGRWGVPVFLGCAYLSLIISTLLGYTAPASLIALASLYFAVKASAGIIRNYADGGRLVPSIKSIILAHLTAGILLVLSNLI